MNVLRDSKLMVVIAVAVSLWIPLAYVDWFTGHEHISYVLRTAEWVAELKRGVLYPRWCSDFYGGYGSPLFMFYAPVPYAVAGFLTATFLDPFSSLKVVALASSVFAGVGTYALIFNETRDRDAAFLGAIAYLAAPYRIMNLFERSDIGELACIGLLPGAIALYRAVALEARPLRARWLAAGAAAFHAVVIMTHAILGLWGTLLIGVVVAGTAVGLARVGMWRRALVLVGALACAPGLAAIYIIPAMAYRDIARTAGMVVGWYNPEYQWIFIKTLFSDDVPGTAMPGKLYKIGPILVAAAIAVAIGLFRDPRRAGRAIGWLALTAIFIWLTLPQASWFWAPHRIPLVVFTQFPWRLLGPAVLTASVALGIGLAAAFKRMDNPIRNALVITGSTTMLLALAFPLVKAKAISTNDIPTDPAAIRSLMYSATEADEYLPAAAPSAPSAPRGALVLEATGAVVDMALSDGSRHELVLSAKKDGVTMILGLHGFPGWRVETLAGPALAVLDTNGVGLLRIQLPRAGSYRLRVSFGVPPAARVGTLVSVFSMLALFLLVGPAWRFWRWRMPAFRVARTIT